MEERKQHLEHSNRNLEAFQTAEPQLRQWLSEKELMMTVLGPLSVDPNMLKMQKQQVQVPSVKSSGGYQPPRCCGLKECVISLAQVVHIGPLLVSSVHMFSMAG